VRKAQKIVREENLTATRQHVLGPTIAAISTSENFKFHTRCTLLLVNPQKVTVAIFVLMATFALDIVTILKAIVHIAMT